jgi:hypothetical protein
LPQGIPSHDTFNRVFALIDANQFQQSFISWMQAVQQHPGQQVVPTLAVRSLPVGLRVSAG